MNRAIPFAQYLGFYDKENIHETDHRQTREKQIRETLHSC